MNETHLNRYARILVEHGAGLRQDQELFITAEVIHRDLALKVAEMGYELGARAVSLQLIDPRQRAQLIRRASLEHIEMAHDSERAWLNRAVACRGALISLRGEEDPRLMPRIARDYPERHALFTRGSNHKGRVLLNHGINRGLCPWVVAGAATPAWAKLVFPDLDESAALECLWEHILRFTYADEDDFLDKAQAKDRRLHARRDRLDALKIREIHIVGGASDLRVGLSEKARWLGGSKTTADGQRFNANVPTEENFTTPDRRRVDGTLAATMPFRTKSGLLVKDLVMHFEAGKLVRFEASEGQEGFERWVDSDDGARYLGELALVGADSPIAESGLFFEHTLFDENAWAHAALGQAYATALQGGEDMSAAEREAIGCNTSTIHTDIMFGSPEVSIIATDSADGEVTLIDKGHWTRDFLNP